MFAHHQSKERAGIEALTSRLHTERIAHYDRLDHRKLAKIALFIQRVARTEADKRRKKGAVGSPLGLATAFNIRRNYLLVLLTASAVAQARAIVGPKTPLYVAELGSGTGINCLTAALCDENTHIYAFEKNPELIQLTKRIFNHFRIGQRLTTIAGDFLTHDMSKHPKFNVVVNENIHMGSFNEPLFEAASAIKSFVAPGAVMVPEGFSAEYTNDYFGSRTQVAQVDLLNLPERLEYWTATSLKSSDKGGHLFFEITSQGKNIFRTRQDGDPSNSVGDLILSTLMRVDDGNELPQKDGVHDGALHRYEGRVRVPIAPKPGTSTLLKILLRQDVAYGDRVSGLCQPYWLYSWNK